MDKTLRALADRAEITDLMDRYLLSLDERKFDESWARSMFTADGSWSVARSTVSSRGPVPAGGFSGWRCVPFGPPGSRP